MKKLIDNFSLRVTQEPLGVKHSLGKRGGWGGYFNQKVPQFWYGPSKILVKKNRPPFVVTIRLAARQK